MGTQFSWFYDVLTVALIVGFLYVGGKRGFIRSVILIAGYVISFILAFAISKSAAPVIYEKFVQPRIVSAIEKNIEKVDITTEIKKALGLDTLEIDIPKEELISFIKVLHKMADNIDSLSLNNEQ